MKLFKMIKRNNILFISGFILLGFISLIIYYSWINVFNIYDSGKGLINTFVYFFQFVFINSDSEVKLVTDLIPTYPGIFNPPGTILPPPSFDYNVSYVQFLTFLELLVNPYYWHYYILNSVDFMQLILRVILLFSVIIPIIIYCFNNIYEENNKDSNYFSKPLILFKRLELKLNPFIDYVKAIFYCIFNFKPFKYLLIVALLYSCNVGAIILDLISTYFFFFSSFDLARSFGLIAHSFNYLFIIISYIPLWIQLVLLYFIFNYLRKKIAYKKLNNMLVYDRSFIDKLGVVVYINGAPGSGKNLHESLFVYLNEQIFRSQALDIINKYSSYFPDFNYPTFYKFLDININKHKFLNRFQIISFFERYITSYYNSTSDYKKFLNKFNYNSSTFIYVNNSTCISIIESLSVIAQAYIIYNTNSPLASSNYSIRFDFKKIQQNSKFPLFKYHTPDSTIIDSFINTQYCHVLNFDSLRLGKKVTNNTQYHQYGCISITEAGKERGNQYTQEGNRDDHNANTKNDKFNYYLKTFRHISSLDNKCFIRTFMDEQRKTSLEADASDLAESHIMLGEQKKNKTTLFLYGIEESLCLLFISFRNRFINRFESLRSDNTLIKYLINKINYKAINYYESNYYRFSYTMSTLEVNDGSKENSIITYVKFFLPYYYVYSSRYKSNCYEGYFKEICKNDTVSYDDTTTYNDLDIAAHEFDKQNSYFVNNVLNKFSQNKEDKLDENDLFFNKK